jgi:hypothetical protein
MSVKLEITFFEKMLFLILRLHGYFPVFGVPTKHEQKFYTKSLVLTFYTLTYFYESALTLRI